ncbi:MAG: DUF3604 domain-containing protein [Victivallales bacterium]|nr:DUF3604 domain-containing protein [Victivallales bacterium]
MRTRDTEFLSLSRRQALGLGSSAVGMAFLPSLGMAQATRQASKKAVVFETRFAPGDPRPVMNGLTVVPNPKARGGHCAQGEITQPNKHQQLGIPLVDMDDRDMELTVRLRSDKGSRCAIWLRSADGKRRRVGSIDKIPRQWKTVTFRFETGTIGKGELHVVAPSSYNGVPGKAWVDEIKLTAGPSVRVPYAKGTAEDFPVMAKDEQGTIWMASLVRDDASRKVGVWRIVDGERQAVAMLDESTRTGIDRPALAGTANGCVVAYPIEQNDAWQLQPVWIDGASGKVTKGKPIAAPAKVNMLPAIACRGQNAVLVWGANAKSQRGVWSCQLTPGGNTAPVQISTVGLSCCNPDVAILPNGDAFAVWDSFRNDASNLFGAWHRNGKWQPERQLTKAGLLERHPRLALRNNEIWLAWQAQSFNKHAVNGVREQRVVVARMGRQGLEMPVDLFTKIAHGRDFLLRPVPQFDPQGRLWLTVRNSMGQHSGWLPQAWCYTGSTWHGPVDLWPDQGRWRPVTMVWDGEGRGLAAIQRDDLPKGWHEHGIRPDWLYQAQLVAPDLEKLPADAPKLVPLAMPETEFHPRQRVLASGAKLPRQEATTGQGPLTLFWGDFHEHSDISVCQRRANPPMQDVYANQRDLEMLDFTAITDHGYNYDRPQWAHNGEQVRMHHDEGRFITFLAEEWTSDHLQYKTRRSYRKYGHRNHIFLDPYHDHFYDSRDGDITPRQLWKQLGKTEFIAIPHQLADTGNCPTDWREIDEKLQPVAEIFQARESFEYLGCPRQAKRAMKEKGHFLQDAWEQGVIIGTIASPDHGGGRGKIGVWAPELTREAIFAAVRARHTFGTSGGKIGLLFQQGDHLMGDKVTGRPDQPTFSVRATAMHPIKEVVIFRNNQIVHRVQPGSKTIEFEWRDQSPATAERHWYYTRVHCEDDELAWSSPIWFLA